VVDDALSCHERYLRDVEAAVADLEAAKLEAQAAYEAIMAPARKRHARALTVAGEEYDRRRAQHEAKQRPIVSSAPAWAP